MAWNVDSFPLGHQGQKGSICTPRRARYPYVGIQFRPTFHKKDRILGGILSIHRLFRHASVALGEEVLATDRVSQAATLYSLRTEYSSSLLKCQIIFSRIVVRDPGTCKTLATSSAHSTCWRRGTFQSPSAFLSPKTLMPSGIQELSRTMKHLSLGIHLSFHTSTDEPGLIRHHDPSLITPDPIVCHSKS